MDSDDDEARLGDTASLGLQRILQQAGVDASTISSILDTSGGQGGASASGAQALIDEDVSDGEDRFMDDVSDVESVGEKEARQRKTAADEARWMKRAMQMQQEIRPKAVTQKEDRQGKVQKVWPEWEKGQRLRMTEVFYDTPSMVSKREAELGQAKRRKLEHPTRPGCEYIFLTT